MKQLLLRTRFKRWHQAFPMHWVLAALVAINGFALLQPGIVAVSALRPPEWTDWFHADSVEVFLESFGIHEIPQLMLGAGLQIMAFGLIFKARLAWTVSLLLLICTTLFLWWRQGGYLPLTVYSLLLMVLLLVQWRRFDRSSVAAGSLFALVSITSLFIYAVFGALYLGNEFQPPIVDGATAFYFSIVSMSTVGYGDITPHTQGARLFTASVIILGITVFATSISAIAGPIIGGNVQRLLKGRFTRTMRKDHIIIAGLTPLAESVYHALHQRGHEVTVIVPPDSAHNYPDNADLLVGDATDTAVLELAGASRALYVLALRSDDSENAFIILAAKEICGPQTRTVALANTATHLKKIKQMHPDVVFSLQSLGAEVLSRLINGESIDNEMITNLLFPKGTGNA